MNQKPSTRLTPSLRLTPSSRSSPKARSPANRSPVKQPREDQCLLLKQVIGSTSASNNAFDCSEAAGCFAFAAGGAAIVATIDQDLHIKQSFYRAKPSTGPLNISTPIYDSPTPTQTPQLLRRGSNFRDSIVGPPIYASSPAADVTDSPSIRLAAARERTKAATCISLSRDGSFVAVGETGHKPRVLIFSTAPGAPTDAPLTALTEHTFGVKAVAFSPDNRFLASLGDVNDGFLYIWGLNQRTGSATIHSSNKCTSNVKQMAWLDNTLITVGLRHVKVWRVEGSPSVRSSPSKRVIDFSALRTLSGRNCLLGNLLDKVFSCVTAIASGKAIVCSEQGDICLLDDTEEIPKFYKVADAGFGILCVSTYAQRSVVVAGAHGEIKLLSIDWLLNTTPGGEVAPGMIEESFRPIDSASNIIAMKALGENLLTLDTQKSLQLLHLTLDDNDGLSNCALMHRFPAHAGAVLGIQSFEKIGEQKIEFMTYSADGVILLWNAAGTCIRDINVPLVGLDSSLSSSINELKTARVCSTGDFVITGDKTGHMRAFDIQTSRQFFEIKAHTAEITSIDVHRERNRHVMCSAGRDRVLQLFSYHNECAEHSQTLDEHAGAVTGVKFSTDGSRLISCSSDRTVVVRERLQGRLNGKETTAYLLVRTITLKSAPLSVDMTPGIGSKLLVSGVDRTMTIFDTSNGAVINSFKASDSDGGDAVVMSTACLLELSRECWGVAGLSSTDKSIRVYDQSGRLLGREYGHTEGMSGLALMKDEHGSTSIITAATDGTVFVWLLTYGTEALSTLLEGLVVAGHNAPPSSFVTRPPLRKVLSSSEILQLQQSRSGAQEKEFGAALVRARSKSPQRKASRSTLGQRSIQDLFSKSTTSRPEFVTPVSGGSKLRAGATAAGVSVPVRKSSRVRPSSPEVPPRFASQTLRSSAARPTVSGTNNSIRRPRSENTLRSSQGIGSGVNQLTQATEQICRSLVTFRKKLEISSDVLALESVRELERELSTTAKTLAEKAARNETVMVKMLDQYSERLLGILDDKIAEKIAAAGMAKT